ncbi:MAG: pyruvate, phosphate dikinase [bacterium]|jgi:pyruvate,orthophosphate dikinase
MSKKKLVYTFAEGNGGMKSLLGGKGAGLAEMTSIGLPVPPGFTITTEACNQYIAGGRIFPDGLAAAVAENVAWLEAKTQKSFGQGENPLLVSVRSGAAISMPGMMDTILNLGLNDDTVKSLAARTGNERFAYDCYRRFIQMFGDVVMKVEHHEFEAVLAEHKRRQGVSYDSELTADALRAVVNDYQDLVRKAAGTAFPQDPREQLLMAVRAVFDSWSNPRAITYRKVSRIPDDLGTAVNVQAMVFGNMGDDCATGVAFTRNPSDGTRELYGEYLINAQGEDVVAGIRTPKPISELAQEIPAAYREFARLCDLLEKHYRDVQDIEFTIENGTLYLLQTRTGKRTANAAVKIAADLVSEGVITKEEALLRVEPGQISQVMHRRIDPDAKLTVIASGLPASPGAASGIVIFDVDEAEKAAGEGHKVILVRPETTPDDIHGMIAAQGILTTRGGMTSHAAVVARGMGKPCVSGCEAIKVNLAQQEFTAGGVTVRAGDVISIDGALGQVILGQVPMIDPELSDEFQLLLTWADEIRHLGVRANADNPEDANRARELGAAGIGLCRTEHMFFAPDRLPIVQQMIMAETKEDREAALVRLLPIQQGDFEGILRAMDGYPVTIRLLDPPLHEFLPNAEEILVDLTKMRLQGGSEAEIKEKEGLLRKVRSLSEFNPMLGLRGCRLGIVYPEIYEMQVKAILQATVRLLKDGYNPMPEIMIPLVGHEKELIMNRDMVNRIAREIEAETGIKCAYPVGTMIELPRACLVADRIAASADFFSFGTNDLTQTAFGFSRDDAEGKFLHQYVADKILPENPFAVLDRDGVGKLVSMAFDLGKRQNPDLKVGICGEHGGDPNSIEFCHLVGLTYVSCSPFRVPVARLAAAQAAVKH